MLTLPKSVVYNSVVDKEKRGWKHMNEKFIQRLQDQNMKFGDLARATHMNRTTIYAFVSQRRWINVTKLSTVIVLAEALECDSVYDILDDTDTIKELKNKIDIKINKK